MNIDWSAVGASTAVVGMIAAFWWRIADRMAKNEARRDGREAGFKQDLVARIEKGELQRAAMEERVGSVVRDVDQKATATLATLNEFRLYAERNYVGEKQLEAAETRLTTEMRAGFELLAASRPPPAPAPQRKRKATGTATRTPRRRSPPPEPDNHVVG